MEFNIGLSDYMLTSLAGNGTLPTKIEASFSTSPRFACLTLLVAN